MHKLEIISKRKIWFALSGILVGLSIIFFFVWGLDLGIDFTGGSLLEVQYQNKTITANSARESLSDLKLSSLTIQPTDSNGLILRFQETSEETHQQIIEKLKALSADEAIDAIEGQGEIQVEQVSGEGGIEINGMEVGAGSGFEELRFESVGPSVGKELQTKAIYSMILVLIAIIVYVAWAFRKVSKPVASWKYGLAGIIAVFHDVVITVGLFCFLGKFFFIEVNSSFVAALLMVLGYSINDTIVVFDRIRENLPKSDQNFEGTVNRSLNETMARSINTSLTTMLVLLSIVVLGGESIRYFALALFAGIFVGTYSSIFLASPLLIWFEKLKK